MGGCYSIADNSGKSMLDGYKKCAERGAGLVYPVTEVQTDLLEEFLHDVS